MELVKNIKIAEEFSQQLLGTSYVWWLGETILGSDLGPFWAANAPVPSLEVVKAQGVCCTGVPNLIRRKLGLSVPGVLEEDPMAGGTGAWETFLKPHWEPFDPTKEYEDWTAFFRPYVNFEDQGHIAIKVKTGLLLHSYVEDPTPKEGFIQPGCTLDDSWKTSHNWVPEGYYLYAAPPSAWLL